MSRKRVKYFEIGNKEKHIDFGTYALILYYAKQLDSSNAKLFFEATLSEYFYRVYSALPTNDLSYEDDEVHFDVNDLQQVVAFIDSQLCPALKKETQDLLEKYGGKNNFYELCYADQGFLENISIDNDEFYCGDAGQLVFSLNLLKELFQYALSVNRPYEVYIY